MHSFDIFRGKRWAVSLPYAVILLEIVEMLTCKSQYLLKLRKHLLQTKAGRYVADIHETGAQLDKHQVNLMQKDKNEQTKWSQRVSTVSVFLGANFSLPHL